jgi:hypothetical protein
MLYPVGDDIGAPLRLLSVRRSPPLLIQQSR